MEEPDAGEPPTADPVATANLEDVIKYLKKVSLCVFEENEPCPALDKVNCVSLQFLCVQDYFLLMAVREMRLIHVIGKSVLCERERHSILVNK